jgi:hypothetical protein
MRFLGRCFAISVVSGLLGLPAFSQPMQPTTISMLSTQLVPSQYDRDSILSIGVDQREHWVAAKHAVFGTNYSLYMHHSLTAVGWKRDSRKSNSSQGIWRLGASDLRIKYHARSGTNLHDPANQHSTTQHALPRQKLSNSRYYTNSDGQRIHSPAYSRRIPAGATAVCADGSYSFSQHRSGTCSHHGGVANWR